MQSRLLSWKRLISLKPGNGMCHPRTWQCLQTDSETISPIMISIKDPESGRKHYKEVPWISNGNGLWVGGWQEVEGASCCVTRGCSVENERSSKPGQIRNTQNSGEAGRRSMRWGGFNPWKLLLRIYHRPVTISVLKQQFNTYIEHNENVWVRLESEGRREESRVEIKAHRLQPAAC